MKCHVVLQKFTDVSEERNSFLRCFFLLSFLLVLTLQFCWRNNYVLQKRQWTSTRLHGITFQKIILYNVTAYLIHSDHKLYKATPLKTPFGLVIPLLQSHSHVTTVTIISYAVTRLHNYNPYTFVTTITCSALERLHNLHDYAPIFTAL
jgi:hypothetical protein